MEIILKIVEIDIFIQKWKSVTIKASKLFCGLSWHAMLASLKLTFARNFFLDSLLMTNIRWLQMITVLQQKKKKHGFEQKILYLKRLAMFNVEMPQKSPT